MGGDCDDSVRGEGVEVRKHLLDFLVALEAAVPPRPGRHYAISRARYGSDHTEWEDRLALHVHRDGKKTPVLFLDDSDFDIPVQELVAMVIDCLDKVCSRCGEKCNCRVE